MRCRISDHFPSPDGVQYIPVSGDSLSERPLWDVQLWPQLVKSWEAFDPKDPAMFYRNLASTPFNPDRKLNVWSFDTQSIAYELRCYLWHLFRYFHLKADKHIQEQGRKGHKFEWKWNDVLHPLLAEFSVAAVSFNYDQFLDTALYLLAVHIRNGTYAIRPPIPVLEGLDASVLLDAPAGSLLIHRIHGSVRQYIETSLTEATAGSAGPHPWKAATKFGKNIIVGVHTRINPPDLTNVRFPLIPDIVPPGHPGDDVCYPVSHALDRAKEQIAGAKLVLFCGISGSPPDTEEVRSLVGSISPGAVVIHIGLEADRTGCLAGLFDNAGLKDRVFVDADKDFDSIGRTLRSAFPLRYSW